MRKTTIFMILTLVTLLFVVIYSIGTAETQISEENSSVTEPAAGDKGASASQGQPVTEAPAPSTSQEQSSTDNQNAKGITEAQAKEIALSQVPGAAESDIREFEVDYDDGRLVYEGKIYYDHMEYEFEIDGYSSAIRNWEVEAIYEKY